MSEISDKDKKDWQEFISSKESLPNKDFSKTNNFKVRKAEIDLHGFTLDEANSRIEKFILEAGSGAGRFTEILLKYGGIVHSFDYSMAVEANAKNNSGNDKLTLIQADIRNIPFEKETYDYVICLGVLQHTPDPNESIRSLWDMLKPGGKLVIDH